jgi:hypothetical protein
MLARPDLAELGLEGIVRSPLYRPLSAMHGRVPVADIRADADPASDRLDQLLFGEAFDVLDRVGDRVWGRARRDGTVGWVDRWSLAGGAPLATHRVAVVGGVLPLNALVHHDFSGVASEDLKAVGDFETDPVAVAQTLLGVPHALGARSSLLTDCSGLVQQALYACGRAGPRHSDQQAELGVAVDRADLARGDLVIWLAETTGQGWTGHSAFALDDQTLIHATGHHGAVVTESLAEAEARYAQGGFEPPVFRRLTA